MSSSSSWVLRPRCVVSFHPVVKKKVSFISQQQQQRRSMWLQLSTKFQRITTSHYNNIDYEIFQRSIRYYTTSPLLYLSTSLPSTNSSVGDNNGDSTSKTRAKPKRSSPSQSSSSSTKRSVSSSAVVATASAVAVPLMEETTANEMDLPVDFMEVLTNTSTTKTTKTRRTKKVVVEDDNNAAATNGTTVTSSDTTVTATPLPTTLVGVSPKVSTPSYLHHDGHKGSFALESLTAIMNNGNETTTIPSNTSKDDAVIQEEHFVPNRLPNTPMSSNFYNHNNNYTTHFGIPGMTMMMMMTPSYNNWNGTAAATGTPHTATNNSHNPPPKEKNHTMMMMDGYRNAVVPPPSNVNSHRNSSSEYIVLSRTPIPTTTVSNDTASNDTTSNTSTSSDVVVDTEGNNDSSSIKEEEEELLLDPYDLIPPNATTGEWKIPYPKALSPSSIKEFQACPQSFLFQYILGLRQPTTTVLAKGTMCHAALERIFDIEPQDRSLSVLQNLFRTAWSEQRTSDTYRILFEDDVLVDELVPTSEDGIDNNDNSDGSLPIMQPVLERRRYIQEERSWGQEGLALLQNYWMAEDASSILRPNPVQREVWVKSNLPLIFHASEQDDMDADPTQSSGTVSTTTTTMRPVTSNVTTAASPTAHVDDDNATNILATPMFLDSNSTLIDSNNISSIVATDGTDETDDAVVAATTVTINNFDNSNITKFLVRGIVDRLDMVQDPNNKTQISLRLIDYKSGKAPDLKYSPSMNLKIQNEAFDQLLIYALLLREANRNKVNPMPLRYLRLFYLTSVHDQKAIYWDMDLGATQEERDAILRTVHVSLSNVYRNICQLIDQQNFKAFQGCQRSFCYCHKCRPKFKPGTVWEPAPR